MVSRASAGLELYVSFEPDVIGIEDGSSAGRPGLAAGSPERTKPQTPATYQVSKQPSPRVQEQEFARQLRIGCYLAAASFPAARQLEPVAKAKARTPKQERPVTKARSKAKREAVKQKAGEEELANERRRAGRVGRGKAAVSRLQRGSPGALGGDGLGCGL